LKIGIRENTDAKMRRLQKEEEKYNMELRVKKKEKNWRR
jgi:hypothetical protein